MGFGLAHSKQGHDCGAVKYPGGKDEKIGQFFECSRERHQTGQHALENQRAAGRAEFWVDAFDDLEEDSVARHGVAHARSAQH